MFYDDLSERKKTILKAVVEAHIDGGEPVGSKYIVQNNLLSCSSATIRNEMAELEQLGYLEQPHTSAGRVPSELGYRFYVDSLVSQYEKATSEVLRDGWLFTGDMAQMDEDGFIFLVDRKKDVIITGGENLYPVQIEDFISAHPAVHDVAVIGLPDKRLGEIATAIIQIKKGHTCTESDIEEFCAALPRYKRPRKIIFADVPRNPTGKIEKPKLRKIYGAYMLVSQQNNS